jgi:hypothetical protein
VVGIFFIPLFFAVIQRVTERLRRGVAATDAVPTSAQEGA